MKKIISLVLALLLTITLVGCANKNPETKYTQPSLSNKDSLVYEHTINGKEITATKYDLYKTIRRDSGLNIVLQIIDEFLLKEYIQTVTTSSKEYISRHNRLAYQSSNEAYINSLSASDKAKMDLEYDYTMAVMGLDTLAKQEAYLKLLAAKDMYTKDFLKEAQKDEDNDYYVDQDEVEAYYNSENFDSTKAIIINFSSMNDYRSAIKSLGLVTYNSELRLYTGASSIDSISQRELNNDNTRVLTKEEALDKFVQLYNLVSDGYKETATVENVLTSSDFDYSFEALSVQSSSIAKKLFALDKDEYTYTATLDKVSYGNNYTLIYRLDGEAKAQYKDLTETERAAILDEYLDTLVLSSQTEKAAMLSLRLEKNIEFFDRYLAYEYTKSVDPEYGTDHNDETLDEPKVIEGHETVLAKVDGKEVTCDDFYNFQEARSLNYYILLTVMPDLQSFVGNYSLVFGEEKDLDKNASLRKVEYVEKLREEIKQNVGEGMFATEEEFLFSKYQTPVFEDVIKYNFLVNDLKTLLVMDLLFVNNEELKAFSPEYLTKATDVLSDVYDNFYSVKATEVLIYTDYDNDYKADDMNYVIENLDALNIKISDGSTYLTGEALKTSYQTSLNKFYQLLDDASKDKKSTDEAKQALKSLVEEYDNTTITDTENKYYEFKKLGFKLRYVDSSSNTRTYASTGASLTSEINEEYAKLYNEHDDEPSLSYVSSSNLVLDKNGAHFVVLTKVDSKPSFKYEYKENSEYDALCNNENDKPSVGQFAGALYLYFFQLFFKDAETANDLYHLEDYPKLFPTSLNFSTYIETINKDLINEQFINSYYAKMLSTAADDSFDKLATIFTYFISNK